MDKEGVISLGEAFIDFVAENAGNQHYKPMLGGATVNVAVWMGRFGIPAYYLCKLGTDENSTFVEKELAKGNVNTGYCTHSPDKKICGVYVDVNAEGERHFASYVNPTPDEWLEEEELERELFARSKIFYFGSGTLFHEKARKATEKALEFAKSAHTLIAFDVNIRMKRWLDEHRCRETIISFMKRAEIVKMSEDELLFLTGEKTLGDGLRLASVWNIPYLAVTLGGNGACAVFNGKMTRVPGMPVKVADTTGAGDAFMAALLYCFHQAGKPAMLSQLNEYLRFANEAGARAVTKWGAL